MTNFLTWLCTSSLARLIFGLTLSSMAFADGEGLDLKPSEIRGTSSKKQVSVLQNRFFLKSMRPEFGILAGAMLNESYTDTKNIGVRGGMFFNEWLGGEFQYLRTAVSDSEDRRALNSLQYAKLKGPNDPANQQVLVTVDPEVNPIHQVVEADVIAAPFYGKLNIANKLIIYSDLYLTAGLSQLSTDQGNKTGFSYGAGERFYLYESWSVRVDVRNRSFSETRAGEESQRNVLSVDLGASYFFL